LRTMSSAECRLRPAMSLIVPSTPSSGQSGLQNYLDRFTGDMPVDTLRRDTDRDRILRAQEIIDYGIADQIIDTRHKH
ncbi:MAG: ATP-dependent Clp protease proteolytic subunit, partial [Gordonia amarae]